VISTWDDVVFRTCAVVLVLLEPWSQHNSHALQQHYKHASLTQHDRNTVKRNTSSRCRNDECYTAETDGDWRLGKVCFLFLRGIWVVLVVLAVAVPVLAWDWGGSVGLHGTASWRG
jgi:hypothetical protein